MNSRELKEQIKIIGHMEQRINQRESDFRTKEEEIVYKRYVKFLNIVATQIKSQEGDK